jgi:hypothetical protein
MCKQTGASKKFVNWLSPAGLSGNAGHDRISNLVDPDRSLEELTALWHSWEVLPYAYFDSFTAVRQLWVSLALQLRVLITGSQQTMDMTLHSCAL